MRRPPWYLVAVVVAVALAWWFARREPPVETLQAGDPLPAVMVTPLSGGDPRPLSEEVVGLTVVNVFASWCAPCRAEHPALMALKDDGVRIVGLAYRDEAADTQAFLQELGDPYFRVVTDPEGVSDIPLALGGAIPHTLVVARDGDVLLIHPGPLVGTDGEETLAEIRRLARGR